MAMSNYDIEMAMAIESLSRDNGVITIPTDTTYGVIARLDKLDAIDRIYELKGRDRSKPLIILAGNLDRLRPFVSGKVELIEYLSDKFWPGALTIVAKASHLVPKDIMSGGTTIGIRIPRHAVVQELLALLPQGAVASTSANLSGAGAPSTLGQVIKDLADKVDYILPDCGQSPDGSESTIVDLSGDVPRILRQGALDSSLILAAINDFVAE